MKKIEIYISIIALASFGYLIYKNRDKFLNKEKKKLKQNQEIEKNLDRIMKEGVTIFEKPLFEKNEKGIFCIQPPCF
jgi:HKD family nuclease